MAMQYNFQPLTFADYNGMESEANRRYYDSLGSIGGTIAKTGEKVDSYLQRKQKEEEDKKKWDNMIAEQEYRKEQDRINREHTLEREAIADARYNEEQRIKKEEARHAAYKEMNSRAALEKYREGLKKSYTPEFLKKYGPTAQAELEAALAVPTIAESMAAGSRLGQIKYQQDMMDFQREQANLDRVPNQTVTQVNDTLSRENIDLNSRRIPYKVNEKREKVKDVDEIQRQIEVAENQLKQLEPLGPNDNASAKRLAVQAYIKFLKDSLQPGAKSIDEMSPEEWLKYVYQNGLKK